MLSPDLKNALPTTDELPCLDDTPVDNVDRRAWRSRRPKFFAQHFTLLTQLYLGKSHGLVLRSRYGSISHHKSKS